MGKYHFTKNRCFKIEHKRKNKKEWIVNLISWTQSRCKCGRFLSKGQEKNKFKLCKKCGRLRNKINHNEYLKTYNWAKRRGLI